MDYAGIDYLTLRFGSCSSPQNVIEFVLVLDADLFTHDKGRYGYSDAFHHGNINVYYGGRPEMGICGEMSGQGCKEFVTQRDDDLALPKLLHCLSEEDAVTRIDIAFDDRDSRVLDFQVLKEKIDKGEVRTKLRNRYEAIDNGGETGHTLYIGSRDSNYYVRIYDKAAEQKQHENHWIRVEQVFRHEEANRFVQYWLKEAATYESIEDKFQCLFKLAAGVLINKFAFVVRKESNSCRSVVCDWWRSFLSDTPPVRIPRATVSPAVERAKKWLEKSVAPTLGALMLILGEEWTCKFLWRSLSMCGFAKSRFHVLSDLWKAAGKEPAYEWDSTVMASFLLALAEEIERKNEKKEGKK